MIRTEDLERLAVLADVVTKLREKGSWVGRTHLQKAALFLQDLLGVPLKYDFFLYYYGPYSLELDNDVQLMRVLNIVDIEPMGEYGPRYRRGESSLQEYGSSVGRYSKQIRTIAGLFGSKSAAEVELLATVFYVMNSEGLSGDELAGRVKRLKPRFSSREIEQAILEVAHLVESTTSSDTPAPPQH